MRRSVLFVGIALLIIGIVVVILAVPTTLPNTFGSQINQMQLHVGSNATNYVSVYLNNTGLIGVTFNATSPVDFYLVTGVVFNQVSTSKNISAVAKSLYGNGVYEAYINATAGVFPPLTTASLLPPAYAANTTRLPAGTYYALFYNSGNRSANVSARYISLPASQLQASVRSIGTSAGGMGIILCFVGVIVIIAAVFLKAKPNPNELSEEAEVQKEYERIERAGRKRALRKRAKNRRKKRK